MNSIGARLALWYAAAATLSMLALFIAGYYLLQRQLVSGLDQLNAAQFAQIQAHLGEDFAGLSPTLIDARIRETSDFSSVLFFITVDDRNGPIRPVFYSTNLRGLPIPDVPGQRVFNTILTNIGEVRAGEFLLGPFDVTIATPLTSVRSAMHDYSEIGLWMLAFMVTVSMGIGLGLSRLALRPIRAIRDTADHISSDNLSERIPVGRTNDEIAELASLLNRMFDRLETAFDQIRRFTADASHELKTPLSMIRLHAEKLLMYATLDTAGEDAVHAQLEEIARLSQIIEEMLFLSRAEAQDLDLKLAPLDPEILLNGFGQDARVLCEHRGVTYEQVHEGQGTIMLEPRWMRRVLLNIVTNALDASQPGSTITLSSVIDGPTWRVSLEDEGTGVPAEYQQKIFERFFRLHTEVRGACEGSGLGLAICRSVVSLHRGQIWADSIADSSGLRVNFTVPTCKVPPHQEHRDSTAIE